MSDDERIGDLETTWWALSARDMLGGLSLGVQRFRTRADAQAALDRHAPGSRASFRIVFVDEAAKTSPKP